MGILNCAQYVQFSYLQQISAYARYFSRSPDALGSEDVRTNQVTTGSGDGGGRCARMKARSRRGPPV